MAKRNKSDEITSNDGRKGNKRLPSKVDTRGVGTTAPARMNNAKKKRLSNYAINAMKNIFGSEQDAMDNLAEQAKGGSLGHFKLLLEYGYGKATDDVEGGPVKVKSAPVINFNYNPAQQLEENTIDIEAEDIEAEDE
jgi:hypothetical protein